MRRSRVQGEIQQGLRGGEGKGVSDGRGRECACRRGRGRETERIGPAARKTVTACLCAAREVWGGVPAARDCVGEECVQRGTVCVGGMETELEGPGDEEP